MEVGHYITSSLLLVGTVGKIESIHGADAIIIMLFFDRVYIISWIRINVGQSRDSLLDCGLP